MAAKQASYFWTGPKAMVAYNRPLIMHPIILLLLTLHLLSATSWTAPSIEELKIEHRIPPQYDSRGPEPTTTAEALLWIPRVILFPAYVVTEYGFRAPLRWLGREAELNNLPFQVIDIFKFGEDNKYAIYPTLLVDFGFRVSAGFFFRIKSFLRENHRLSIRAATGGTDYGTIKISDEMKLSDHSFIRIAGEIGKRPDFIFHAMGPFSTKESRYRYAEIKKGAELIFETDNLWGSTLTLDGRVRDLSYSNGNSLGDPGIETAISTGVFPAPSRYPSGFSSFSNRVHFNRGNRVSRPKERIGVITDLTTQHDFDFKGGGWWIFGGAFTGYLDLTGKSRVIALRLETEVAKPEGGKEVPFSDLPSLGGDRLPGFLSRRFIGESVFAGTLEYKWPVLSVVDGVAHFGVGNVFGKDLKGFNWGWFRKSIGFGLESTGPKSSNFGIIVAFGSKPFDLGGQFDEFRFSLRFGAGI